MEVVVITGAIRRAKLQSNRHHQQTNTQLFTGQMPFLPPYKQCPSTERKYWSQPVTTNSYHNKYGLTMNAWPDNDKTEYYPQEEVVDQMARCENDGPHTTACTRYEQNKGALQCQ